MLIFIIIMIEKDFFLLSSVYRRRPHKIAIFTDFPNIEIGIIKNTYNDHFEYAIVERFAQCFGEIILSKIYADWSKNKVAYNKLSKTNVQLVNVKHIQHDNKLKDLVDTKMATDIGITLLKFPKIDLIILVSGDADFLPVIKTIREYKRQVFIVSEENSLSCYLISNADTIYYYQDIEELIYEHK